MEGQIQLILLTGLTGESFHHPECSYSSRSNDQRFPVRIDCASALPFLLAIVFLQGFAIGLIVSIKRDNSKQEYPYLYRYMPKNDLRYCYLFLLGMW